jgi:hypothetical protein
LPRDRRARSCFCCLRTRRRSATAPDRTIAIFTR